MVELFLVYVQATGSGGRGGVEEGWVWCGGDLKPFLEGQMRVKYLVVSKVATFDLSGILTFWTVCFFVVQLIRFFS